MSGNKPIILLFLFVIVVLSFTRCTVDTHHLPLAQELLMAKPWRLNYTDTSFYDSSHNIRSLRIFTADCEKQQVIAFQSGYIYTIQPLCAPPLSTMEGTWMFYPDSTIAYGEKGDTGVNKQLHSAFLKLVSDDSLVLEQESNFRYPDTRYRHYSKKVYGR